MSRREQHAPDRSSRRVTAAAPGFAARPWLWTVAALVVVAAGTAVVLMVANARALNAGVPDPDTSAMQPRVAARLRSARQEVLKQPGSAEAWGSFGAVCDAHQLYDEAALCYRRARALAPGDFPWPYLLANIREFQGAAADDVAALLREAAQLEPDFPPVFFRIGQLLARRGQLAEAREAYLEAIRLDPTLAIAHRSLGQVLIGLGDPQSALHHLQRAREYGPEDRAVFAALAQTYALLGDQKSAEQAAETSRRLNSALAVPDPVRYAVQALGISPGICTQRARQLMAQGKYVEAIEQLKIVEESLPDDPHVHRRLGTSYLRTNQAELAIQHLSKAVRLQDDLVDAHLQLASLLIARGQLDEAIQHFRRAATHAPTNSLVHFELATALARRGDYDEAVALFEKATALAPADAQIQMNWGVALMHRGDAAEAIVHYRQAIQLSPNYTNAHFNLGLALEKLGRTNEAIAAYRHAVRIDPNHAAGRRLAQLGG